jgi:hypothetical protein
VKDKLFIIDNHEDIALNVLCKSFKDIEQQHKSFKNINKLGNIIKNKKSWINGNLFFANE